MIDELDAAHRLLLACALAAKDSAVEPMARAIAEVRDWDRALAGAAAHQLRPPLAAWLSKVEAPGTREAMRRVDLERTVRAHAGHGLMMAAELIRVLGALRSAGVAAVAFKGPAFATLVGDGPAARETGDLDILIGVGDIGAAGRALAPLGLEPMLPLQAIASPWLPRVTNELGLVRRDASILVELHWRLAPAWHPVPIEPSDVLGRLGEREFFGATIAWPSPEELLLVHVADGMKSGGFGLRWVGDVARIVRSATIDWKRVESIARRTRGFDMVSVALAIVARLANDLARKLDAPAIAVELPRPAGAIAERAWRSARLGAAARHVCARLASDRPLTGAGANFRWALAVADRRAHVALAIARYLAGPATADLQALPPRGLSNLQLRARTLRRRLGAYL